MPTPQSENEPSYVMPFGDVWGIRRFGETVPCLSAPTQADAIALAREFPNRPIYVFAACGRLSRRIVD